MFENIFQISSPALPLSREVYKEQLANLTFLAYHDHQLNLALLFGADKEKAETDLLEVLTFEVALSDVRIKNQIIRIFKQNFIIFRFQL